VRIAAVLKTNIPSLLDDEYQRIPKLAAIECLLADQPAEIVAAAEDQIRILLRLAKHLTK